MISFGISALALYSHRVPFSLHTSPRIRHCLWVLRQPAGKRHIQEALEKHNRNGGELHSQRRGRLRVVFVFQMGFPFKFFNVKTITDFI